MDNIEVNVDFLINNPQLKTAAEQAKREISGVGVTAEQTAQRVQANTERVINNSSKRSIEALQTSIKNMQDFASSTTSEKAIANSNRKIQDMQAEVKRLSNLGKAGFDELGNKIVEVGTKAGASTGVFNKMWSGLKTIANILPGLGIAGLLAFAIDPIMEYLSTLDLFKPKLSEVELANKQLQTALGAGGEYAKAIANVESLRINLDLAEKGQYSSKAALEQYNSTIGAVAGQVKTLDEAEKGLVANADAFIAMTLKKSIAQLTLEEASKKAVEAMQKRTNRELSPADYLKYGVQKVAGVGLADMAIGLQKEREEAAKKLEKESEELVKISTKAQAEAAKLAKQMGGILGGDKSKSAVVDKSIADAESLQRRIYEMQAEFSRKSKSKDEEELQALRDRFAKIFEEVEKFNKNPKNKVKVDGSGLLATRDTAMADLEYRQSTERVKIAFEEQKKVFAEYEEYKKNFGEERAKARYSKELEVYKEFVSATETEYKNLTSKSDLTGGESERMKALKKLLDEQKLAKLKIDDASFKEALDASQTYFDKVYKIEQEYQAKRKALQANGALTAERLKELDDAKVVSIDNAKDEALQKTAIYKKLSVELLEYTRRQIQEQIALIREMLSSETNLPAEIRNKLESELGTLESRLKIGVSAGNLSDLQARKKQLLTELNSVDETGQSIISDKERRRIMTALAEIQSKIKDIDTNQDGKVSWADKVAKQFEYLKGDSEEMANGLANDLGRVSSGFEQAGQAVGGVNTGLGRTILALSSMLDLASDVSKTLGSFASGDIVGGVMGVVGVISSVIGMMGASAEASQKYYYDAILGEQKLNEALRERALLNAKINKTAIEAAAAQTLLLKASIVEMKNESTSIYDELAKFKTMPLAGKTFEELQLMLAKGYLSGNAKALVERLVELEKKTYDAEQAIRDLNAELSQLFTGTTADNLADSLVEMFQEGKTSVQDFVDFFEKTMSDAALSIFKNKVLAEAMDKFYKEFSNNVADGSLDAGEMSNLKRLFDSLTNDAGKQFEALKQITGLNLGSGSGSSSSGSSVTGVIQRSITEQTGSELVGLYRSMYDLNKRHFEVSNNGLSVLREQLLSQKAIESNTANTVEQLKLAVVQLKGINKNTYSTNRGYDLGF